MIKLKRAYDPPEPSDGLRVLVDRLWPRGLRKDQLAVDHWLRDVAPSPDLRRWYSHDPAKWREFSERYRAELQANPALDQLAELCRNHPVVTLVYAARDTAHAHAQVLLDLLPTRP
jgi:uncharacterized protein YeaO (DUF488 family)